MEADFNRKNQSTYASRLNARVAEKFVNIVDDATLPDARGSIHFDDEASDAGGRCWSPMGSSPRTCTTGVSAAHYKVAPTGSGRRESFRHPIQPRMRATYMLGGPHKARGVIRSVKRGIYCESFSNGEVDIGPGDYTFFVKTGFLIEDGKLGRPVKDTNLIGNGPDSLTKITMVADDMQMTRVAGRAARTGRSVPVSLGMPTVLVVGRHRRRAGVSRAAGGAGTRGATPSREDLAIAEYARRPACSRRARRKCAVDLGRARRRRSSCGARARSRS